MAQKDDVCPPLVKAVEPSLYGELDSAKHEIRLVKFDVDALNLSELRLVMTTHVIEEAPIYRALSYAWGPEELRQIHLNAHIIDIRINLFNFLQQFRRRSTGNDWIWVDQLCINQGSIMERNDQVSMMDKIYAFASKTLVWLGLDSHVGRAFAFMEEVLENTVIEGDVKADLLDKVAIKTFCTNPYWTRHWVIQELVLSQRCTLLYGQYTMPLDRFRDAYDRSPSVGLVFSTHLMRLLGLLGDYRLYETHKHPVAEVWLIWYQCMLVGTATSCQDPRDRIYGIQSLFEISQRIKVDYSASVEQVCMRALLGLAQAIQPRDNLLLDDCFGQLIRAMGLSDQHAELWNEFVAQCRAADFMIGLELQARPTA